MARHGYANEGYGGRQDDASDGNDRGGRMDRQWDSPRGERSWGDDDRWQDRDSGGGRGFFDRMREEARSWFSDDDDDHASRSARRGTEGSGNWRGDDRSEWIGGRGGGGFGGGMGRSMSHRSHEGLPREMRRMGNRGYSGSDFGGDWEGNRRFGSNQDDHYRSWRDRQLQALDKDYEDYCREREQQFHQDFGSWRQNRQGRQGSMDEQGSTMGGQRSSDHNRADMSTQGDRRARGETIETVDTDSAATLGTTSAGRAGRTRGGDS